ncbi:DUF726-domain-containing protein [Hesseltinella vesiculosa]|uniref:DUF726-domain-containing protein n=1 Tax=Hesseltinella vesiculosa TaxID=101127 RepID=A0A1X2G768_9FUNG|nr:DUF726-domain-containing protein [Hesseltinella vesiculosa]
MDAWTVPAAVEQISTPNDRRVDVLLGLLSLSLGSKEEKPPVLVYDARARWFLYCMTNLMGLPVEDLGVVERSLGQQMYFEMEKGGKNDQSAAMNSSAQTAMTENNNKKKLYRWLATGAGVVGGGAVIALTGGLAAPLLAPIMVGMTGATFFATAGGIALVTSLFGLTGGGLAGMKMHRRTRGLEEFQFKQILVNKDLPPIPTLQCTICISGFLMDDDKSDTTAPWIKSLENHQPPPCDTFCLEYDTKILRSLGYAFQRFLMNQALRYAGLEVAKQTALASFFAAIALPAALLKVADVIDDPWQLAVERSKKAGVVLADTLAERVQGNRPCHLIGYSCGSLVIWHCLLELERRQLFGLVHHVVLLGSPIASDEEELWKKARSVVAGRFVNGYTPDDWVLAYVYRLHSLNSKVSGLSPVAVDGIENLGLELEGHTSYPSELPSILARIHLE